MVHTEQQQLRSATWEGKLISPTIAGASAEQVWLLLADFCGADRIFPKVRTCCLEAGVNGEPGCVRCTTLEPDGTTWAKETLTSIGHVDRKLSHALGDNNLGWGRYEVSMEVVVAVAACKEGVEGSGCRIEWWFDMDPVEGESLEGPSAFLASMLEGAAKRIQELILLRGKEQSVRAQIAQLLKFFTSSLLKYSNHAQIYNPIDRVPSLVAVEVRKTHLS